jgi:hypothetical protein
MAAAINRPPLNDGMFGDFKSRISSLSWTQWFTQLYDMLSPGITVTITTAKLTGGGTTGSMTFKKGILVDQTKAT